MNLITKLLQVSLAVFIFSASSFANEVNLYSGRHYDSDEQFMLNLQLKQASR
jgi:hypothetical protein